MPEGPVSPAETAAYAADLAHDLMRLCERAGLYGLSTLFFAAHSEAGRAAQRLAQRHGQDLPNAAEDNAA